MKMFPFVEKNNLEELRVSPRFQRHAGKLMNSVGGAIGLLNEPGKLVATLHALGYRHIAYGSKIEQFKVWCIIPHTKFISPINAS